MIFSLDRDSKWSLDWRFKGADAINVLLPKPGLRFDLRIELFNFRLLWIDIDIPMACYSLAILGIYFYLTGPDSAAKQGWRLTIRVYEYRPKLWFDLQLELFNMTVAAIGWEAGSFNIGLLGFDLYVTPSVVKLALDSRTQDGV